MAATTVEITTTLDENGARIGETVGDVSLFDKLTAAINARAEFVRGTVADSTVAAAIMILRSLKASTKKAPVGETKVPEGSYTIQATNLIGGLRKVGGVWKVYCHVRGDKSVSHIRPAVGWAPGSVHPWKTRVYKITTSNPHDKFSKNVNAPDQCWYVLCAHEGQAEAYAKNHIARILSKESGMAKAAISIAQAKASSQYNSKFVTREEFEGRGGMSPRAARVSYDSAEIYVDLGGFNSGNASVTFFDALNYSSAAAGGDGVLTSAIQKAADQMLAIYAKDEVLSFKKTNNELLENFKAHWFVRNKMKA